MLSLFFVRKELRKEVKRMSIVVNHVMVRHQTWPAYLSIVLIMPYHAYIPTEHLLFHSVLNP